MHRSGIFQPWQTTIFDEQLRAQLKKWISDPLKTQVPWDPHDLRRLEFEGMIRIKRRADGSFSSIKLTPYGRYWAQQ